MIIKVENISKNFGALELYRDFSFELHNTAKIALIGRNGVGKSQLFKIITGEDDDYSGQVTIGKNIQIVKSEQEHSNFLDLMTLEYILINIPKYYEYKNILDDHNNLNTPEGVDKYNLALEYFTEKGFYYIESQIINTLEQFGISLELILSPLRNLSGGQKRFVELAKIMYSGAQLALIDEPTNHLDYVGKGEFIEFLKNYEAAAIVITHDRDVLNIVDEIWEIKDQKLYKSKGNYDAYLKQNSMNSVSKMYEYDEQLKKIEETKKWVVFCRKMKLMAGGDVARTSWRKKEERAEAELITLKESLEKPSIWIDSEKMGELSESQQELYTDFKDKQIVFNNKDLEFKYKAMASEIAIRVKELEYGYDKPLKSGISFEMRYSDRFQIKGRNGAGKSTIIKAIQKDPTVKIWGGSIECDSKLIISEYKQEFESSTLKMTLFDYIKLIHNENNIDFTYQTVYNLLGQYLFNPKSSSELTLEKLSGGQKARLQIMRMLIKQPNLLILDEPTNHLDLPSIEEMEKMLISFNGAILYITHDTYFAKNIGGKILSI